jgi:hypothetical protein
MEDAMSHHFTTFKARIALAGLFMLGLLASCPDASAADPIHRKSFTPQPSTVTRQAPTRLPATGPMLGNATRLNPGAVSGFRPVNTGVATDLRPVDRSRLKDLGRLQPAAPGLERLPPPGAGLQLPDLSPPVGVVKDGDRTGAQPRPPTPSAEDRNKRLGPCLVGITSACNGDLPTAGQPGNGKPGGRPTVGADRPAAGSGGGSGGSFNASFDFGAGGGGGAAAQAQAPACVADPTDVYKLLECAKTDFAAGIIDQRQYDTRKADALALLDPEKLGADLILRALRDLVDAGLITQNDREMQKRTLIARL